MIYPPRPTNATTINEISFYEGLGFWGTAKFNGSCVVVDKGVVYDRHGKLQPNWKFNIPPKLKGAVFCGEYMNKGETYKGLNFIVWDVLDFHGSLVGFKYAERAEVLFQLFQKEIFTPEYEDDFVVQIDEGVGLIQNITEDLTTAYNEIVKEKILEGLVLKNPYAELKNWSSDSSNSGWQVKIRKPNKLYSY